MPLLRRRRSITHAQKNHDAVRLRQPDGIHMTAEGHRRVAEQLAASIR
jgi:hypothetical protein